MLLLHLRTPGPDTLSEIDFSAARTNHVPLQHHAIRQFLILNAYSTVLVINNTKIRPKEECMVSNRCEPNGYKGESDVHKWEAADWVSSKDFLVVLEARWLVGCSWTTFSKIVCCCLLRL